MIVEFIKDCPWTLNGRLNQFRKGEIKKVINSEAQSMVENGYATPYSISVVEVSASQRAPEEIIISGARKAEHNGTFLIRKKSEEVENNLDARYDYYIDNFSLEELKQFCKKKKIPLKTAFQRTKPTIIEAIIEFEKEHGQIKRGKNE